jgi:hypothetical protein
LAQLPLLEYELQRADAAEKLGIGRVAVLDSLVKAKRPRPVDSDLQGKAVHLASPVPWEEPVCGATVLSEVSDTLSKYCVLPTGAADAIALWIAHTHVFEAFLCTPRLNLFSPVRRCGKTTTRDVIAAIVPRSVPTENLSCAVLYRLADSQKPIILADEYDTWIATNEELRGILNAGHRQGATVYRCEGDRREVRAFSAFAPAVLAGIGELPATLHDRSVVIRLSRAKQGEVKVQFDSRRLQKEAVLCRKLARWGQENLPALQDADPPLPESAYNRMADNWRPLFAIAYQAGGDWPARATAAYAALTSDTDLETHSRDTMLLADIAAIFADTGRDKLSSAELCERLGEIEGHPWAEFGKFKDPITKNQLAKLLSVFEIFPKSIRLEGLDGTAKGYARADFDDSFDRYLPKTDFPKQDNGTLPANIEDHAPDETEQTTGMLPLEDAAPTNNDAPDPAPPFQGEEPFFEGEDLI